MTSNSQLPAADAQPGHVLRIISGLHSGASRSLAGQEMILVGSGDDCDIVLADAGVASHHALISRIGGRFSLRALDAPLHVGTSLVHPGDPVELANVQRVGLGDAALAFGAEDDAAWDTLAPGIAAVRTAPARASVPYLRRLPAVAAVAALSLASLAIFAAVMPAQDAKVDPRERLEVLIPEYGIDDGRATRDLQDNLVLTGTVKDAGARERIARMLQAEGIEARVDLRTGDDIARDVQEVLRSQGLSAKTRYLGDGNVEVSGRFEDVEALRTAALSRAMQDVKGINRVVPVNSIAVASETPAINGMPAPKAAAVRVVAIVRGKDPHVVGADGRKFAVGSEIPGKGRLISITESSAHALTPDGQLQQIKVEAAVDAATEDTGVFANVRSTATSHM
ncbi:MAG TPA: FHA domain-containing protein [Luteimonas sp.]|nr:FHA domain-containing protein [Luteimonas sp.]